MFKFFGGCQIAWYFMWLAAGLPFSWLSQCCLASRQVQRGPVCFAEKGFGYFVSTSFKQFTAPKLITQRLSLARDNGRSLEDRKPRFVIKWAQTEQARGPLNADGTTRKKSQALAGWGEWCGLGQKLFICVHLSKMSISITVLNTILGVACIRLV